MIWFLNYSHFYIISIKMILNSASSCLRRKTVEMLLDCNYAAVRNERQVYKLVEIKLCFFISL